jgi:hypothetical protein
MFKNNILSTTALGLIFTLSGCSYHERTEGATSFAGDAQAINIAKSTVDPWNRNAYNNKIEGDGERLGETVARYKKDEKEAEQQIGRVNTTSN